MLIADLFSYKLLASYIVDRIQLLLNQARAAHRPARTWFLEIDLVREVCVYVCLCVRPRG